MFFFLNDETTALNFLEEARESSYQNRKSNKTIVISMLLHLEFFDERALKFLAKDFSAVPNNAKAAIWFEQECNDRFI